MHITCDQPTLKNAVEVAGRAIDARTSHPLMSMLKLSTGADFLAVAGTSGHMSIVTRVPATINRVGSVLLPASYLSSYIATLPQVPISMTVDDHVCTVSASTTTAELDCSDAEEFPEIIAVPTADYTALCTLPSATLRFIIASIAFAANPTNPVPAFASIAFLPGQKQLDVVCADSFHMGHCTLPIEHHLSNQLLLHVKDMQLLMKCLRDDSTPVTLYLRHDQHAVLFVSDDTTVMIVTTNGKFPAIDLSYKDVCSTIMTLSVDNLLPFLARATIFTEHRVLLRIEPTVPGQGLLHISTPYVNGVGRILDSTLSVEMSGEPLDMYFVSEQLQEILQAIRHGVFTLSTAGENHRAIITPTIADICPQHYSIMPLLRQAALR